MMFKKLFRSTILAMFFLTNSLAFAAGHSATLSWAAPSDATSGTTYNLYRLAGSCPAAPTTGFTLLSAGITATTYTDSTVTVGSWCYYVTQVQNSTNSAPSNLAGGTAAPLAVFITVTVN